MAGAEEQRVIVPKRLNSSNLLFLISGQATEEQLEGALRRALQQDMDYGFAGGVPPDFDETMFLRVIYREGRKLGKSLLFFRDSRAVDLLLGARWVVEEAAPKETAPPTSGVSWAEMSEEEEAQPPSATATSWETLPLVSPSWADEIPEASTVRSPARRAAAAPKLVKVEGEPAHDPIRIAYSPLQRADAMKTKYIDDVDGITITLSRALIFDHEDLKEAGYVTNVLVGRLHPSLKLEHIRQLLARFGTSSDASYPSVTAEPPGTNNIMVTYDDGTNDMADAYEMLYFYVTDPHDVPGIAKGIVIKMNLISTERYFSEPARRSGPAARGRGGRRLTIVRRPSSGERPFVPRVCVQLPRAPPRAAIAPAPPSKKEEEGWTEVRGKGRGRGKR